MAGPRLLRSLIWLLALVAAASVVSGTDCESRCSDSSSGITKALRRGLSSMKPRSKKAQKQEETLEPGQDEDSDVIEPHFGDLEVVRVLGTGNYGRAYLCRSPADRSLVVVKTPFATLKELSETSVKAFVTKEEVERLHKELSHSDTAWQEVVKYMLVALDQAHNECYQANRLVAKLHKCKAEKEELYGELADVVVGCTAQHDERFETLRAYLRAVIEKGDPDVSTKLGPMDSYWIELQYFEGVSAMTYLLDLEAMKDPQYHDKLLVLTKMMLLTLKMLHDPSCGEAILHNDPHLNNVLVHVPVMGAMHACLIDYGLTTDMPKAASLRCNDMMLLLTSRISNGSWKSLQNYLIENVGYFESVSPLGKNCPSEDEMLSLLASVDIRTPFHK